MLSKGILMKNNWPTKDKDLQIAQLIMEEFATEQQSDSLGLFELVVNQQEKCMNFRLSPWVMVLAKHFNHLYGAAQGDEVTRKVISRCMIRDETLH